MRLLLFRRRATLEKRDSVTGKDGTPRGKVTHVRADAARPDAVLVQMGLLRGLIRFPQAAGLLP